MNCSFTPWRIGILASVSSAVIIKDTLFHQTTLIRLYADFEALMENSQGYVWLFVCIVTEQIAVRIWLVCRITDWQSVRKSLRKTGGYQWLQVWRRCHGWFLTEHKLRLVGSDALSRKLVLSVLVELCRCFCLLCIPFSDLTSIQKKKQNMNIEHQKTSVNCSRLCNKYDPSYQVRYYVPLFSFAPWTIENSRWNVRYYVSNIKFCHFSKHYLSWLLHLFFPP